MGNLTRSPRPRKPAVPPVNLDPPPNSPEAEREVLSAMFLDGRAVGKARELVDADQFYDLRNGRIFGAMLEVFDRDGSVDPLALTEHLKGKGEDDPLSYVLELQSNAVTATRLESHAGIVRDKAKRRRIIDDARRLIEAAGTGADEAVLLAGRYADKLRELTVEPSAVTRKIWTSDELLAANFPEPVFTVDALIPVGLGILGGRPKAGKSYLGLQMAVACGSGGNFLGKPVERVSTLLLALEDSPRRLKNRLTKLGCPPGTSLEIVHEWRLLTEGGLADLEAAIRRQSYGLVIVDTWRRAVGGIDDNEPGEVAAIMEPLQHIAHQRELTILVIDHLRKPVLGAQDVVDEIIGSTTKTATVDLVMALFRGRGRQGTTLAATGRDLEEYELSLRRDPLTACWQSEGPVDGVRADSYNGKVLGAIAALEALGETATGAKIALHLGEDRGHVSRALADLIGKGLILKAARIGREQPYLIPKTEGGEA